MESLFGSGPCDQAARTKGRNGRVACEALNATGISKSPEQVKGFTNMIRDENKRLGLLVESVLRSAVRDSGAMRLRPVDLDLHALLVEVIRASVIRAENMGDRVELRPEAELAYVKDDLIHPANAFHNLVDHAVKFCETAPVVSITTSSDARGIAVAVKDYGIGIPKSEQKKILDRLYRVPNGDRHNVKGFGPGLSDVRDMVGRPGVTIRVESGPGPGQHLHRLPPL